MIQSNDVKKLIESGIITREQGDKILALPDIVMNEVAPVKNKSFSISSVLYYLGGFTMMSAVAFFISGFWSEFGDSGRILVSVLIIAFTGYLGILLRRTTFKLGGDILVFVATATVPLLLYSIETAIGWWPKDAYDIYDSPGTYDDYFSYINSAWVALDIATVAISYFVFRIFKIPLLTLLISNFFWFTVLDGLDYVYMTSSGFDNMVEKSWLSILAGFLLVGWGLYSNTKKDSRIGVWPWIFGSLLVFGSLIALRYEDDTTLMYQILILVFGFGYLAGAVKLQSRTFMTFGAFAVWWFIEDISWTYFSDSLGFWFVLFLSGFATIGCGMLAQRFYKNNFVQ